MSIKPIFPVIASSSLLLLAAPSHARPQDLALITDSGTGGLVVLDAATDTVLGSIDLGLTPDDQDECPGKVAISADGTLGLATDGMNQLWLIDMPAASLSSGMNPVSMISPSTDVAFDIAEQYAVVVGNFLASTVDLATRSEVAFLDVGQNGSAVEVAGDGSVFITSSTSNSIRRFLLQSDGTLVYTGELLNGGGGPADSYSAPGSKTVIAVNKNNLKIRSFKSPLEYVDYITTDQIGYAGTWNSAGTRFYERQSEQLVVWQTDAITGQIVTPALHKVTLPFPSICEASVQIALHPDETKLYVPVVGGIQVRDPADLSLLYTFTDPAIVHPLGIAFPNHPEAVVPYGCGVNPAGSLTLISGSATPGDSFVLGVDNPLGTQPAGSLAFLTISPSPLVTFPCGVALPGFGMSGPGASGELLIDIGFLIDTLSTVWAGAGTPAEFTLPIPDVATHLGIDLYAQGVVFDPGAALGVTFGLTEGALVRIGL